MSVLRGERPSSIPGRLIYRIGERGRGWLHTPWKLLFVGTLSLSKYDEIKGDEREGEL